MYGENPCFTEARKSRYSVFFFLPAAGVPERGTKNFYSPAVSLSSFSPFDTIRFFFPFFSVRQSNCCSSWEKPPPQPPTMKATRFPLPPSKQATKLWPHAKETFFPSPPPFLSLSLSLLPLFCTSFPGKVGARRAFLLLLRPPPPPPFSGQAKSYPCQRPPPPPPPPPPSPSVPRLERSVCLFPPPSHRR